MQAAVTGTYFLKKKDLLSLIISSFKDSKLAAESI